jgi:hypothetical protein
MYKLRIKRQNIVSAVLFQLVDFECPKISKLVDIVSLLKGVKCVLSVNFVFETFLFCKPFGLLVKQGELI